MPTAPNENARPRCWSSKPCLSVTRLGRKVVPNPRTNTITNPYMHHEPDRPVPDDVDIAAASISLILNGSSLRRVASRNAPDQDDGHTTKTARCDVSAAIWPPISGPMMNAIAGPTV